MASLKNKNCWEEWCAFIEMAAASIWTPRASSLSGYSFRNCRCTAGFGTPQQDLLPLRLGRPADGSARFTSQSCRFAEIRNSSLISADQLELDSLPHGIDAFGADTNAVAEMPFHLFCLGAAAMAGARRATAAFLTG